MSLSDFLLISMIYLTTIDVFFIKKSHRRISFIVVLAIVLIVLHMSFDIVRWQVIFLYAYPLYLIIYYALLQSKKQNTIRKVKKYYKIFVLVLVTLSTFIMVLLPVKNLGAPNGDYVIGTKTFNLKDENRTEIYGVTAGEDREIRLQVWYPSDSSEGKKPVKWMIDGNSVTKGYAKSFHLLSFMLDHTDEIYSHSFMELPVSQKEQSYPVVILSHGWTSSRNLHLDLAENLASNGYIVIGVDHTYGAAATKLEDGEVATVDNNALSTGDEVVFLEKARVLIDVYSEDIKYVIDYLEIMNSEDDLLRGRLDIGKVGTFGHSTGAGAGVKAALEDNRIIAVMGMDPWLEPVPREMLQKGLRVHSNFFRSEEWSDNGNNEYLKMLFDNSIGGNGVIQIEGSKHIDFTMLYAYSDIVKYFGLGGKHAGYEYSSIQLEFALDFFNYSLKGINYDIKKLAEKYDDIKIIEINQ